MKEEKYLQIYLSPYELSPNIKNIIMSKLREKYLFREIGGKMIMDIEVNNFNNIPLSNNLEINVLAKVTYKIYKPGDIIIGKLDNNGFVISNDIICEIDNYDDIQSKDNVKVMITNIKSTSGCAYFLAKGRLY